MKKPKPFERESDLCAAFIAWVKREHPDVTCYAEWMGWDILLVYPNGWQIGVQAKLRLNPEVIGQAAPNEYNVEWSGPDYRAVLVPEKNGLADVAARLGLVVFYPIASFRDRLDFRPALKLGRYSGEPGSVDSDWLDWNPTERHGLPPCPTDAVAGSPCPVSLTPWKLRALDLLAQLTVKGTVTTKEAKAHVDPRRWISGGWLESAGDERGVWKRGAACPNFDAQHPTAYALALEKALAEALPQAEAGA